MSIVAISSSDIGTGVQRVMMQLLHGSKETTARTRMDGLKAFASYLSSQSDNAPSTPEGACVALLVLGRVKAKQLVSLWRGEMYDAGVAVNTINSRLTTLRKMVELAEDDGVINWDGRGLGVKNYPSQDYRDTRGCGKDDFVRVLQAITGTTQEDLRDLAILRLAWDRGLRRFEIAGLDIENFNRKTGELRFVGKGRYQQTTVILPDTTRDSINRWLDVHPVGSGAMFVNLCGTSTRLDRGSIYRITKKRGAAVGVNNLRPHAIRHSVCTYLINQGSDMKDVAEFMRHNSIETTRVYFDNARGIGDQLSKVAAAV